MEVTLKAGARRGIPAQHCDHSAQERTYRTLRETGERLRRLLDFASSMQRSVTVFEITRQSRGVGQSSLKGRAAIGAQASGLRRHPGMAAFRRTRTKSDWFR